MTLYRGRYRIESARRPGWDYAAPGWYFVTLCTHRRACVLGEVREGRMRLSGIGRIVADEWQRTSRVRPNVALDAWVIMPDHLHGIIRILPPDDGRCRGGDAARERDCADGGDTTRRDAGMACGRDASARDTGIAPNRNVETPRWGVSTVAISHGPDTTAPTVAITHGSDTTAPTPTIAHGPDVTTPTIAHGLGAIAPVVTMTLGPGIASPPTPTQGFGRAAGNEPPAGAINPSGSDRPRLQAGSLGAIIGQFKSQCTKRIRMAGHDEFAWQARFYDSIIRDRAGLLRVRRYIEANPIRWERERDRPAGLLM
jgi:REP element-mobilizing transposase RayT